MADSARLAVTGKQNHSDYARLTHTDDNLAQLNLVLIWFYRCWAAPPPWETETAQHLASVRLPPVLPGRLSEREFAAFLGPRNSVTGDCCGDAGGFSTPRKAAMQRTPTSRKSGSDAPHRPFNLTLCEAHYDQQNESLTGQAQKATRRTTARPDRQESERPGGVE